MTFEEINCIVSKYAHCCKRLSNRYSLLEVEDIIQEGMVSYLIAKQNFNKKKGKPFKSYFQTILRNKYFEIVKNSYRKNIFQFDDIENMFVSQSYDAIIDLKLDLNKKHFSDNCKKVLDILFKYNNKYSVYNKDNSKIIWKSLQKICGLNWREIKSVRKEIERAFDYRFL